MPSLTNAHFAHAVARLSRRLAQEMEGLALGMWNPDFCTDDAKPQALDLINELRDALDRLERRAG